MLTSSRRSQNLALSAIAGLYLGVIIYGLFVEGLFAPLGRDFLAFWSAGYVANTMGYSKVYDLEALGKIQATFTSSQKSFLTIPSPFLPVFIVPFRIFALLPPEASFFLWSSLNLFLLIYYLSVLSRKFTSRREKKGLLLMLLLAFPTFYSFYCGQINVWLVICLGEFMRAYLERKPLKAGVYLAGLLLKPQTLILLLPFLLLKGEIKALGGFTLAALALLALSILIGGQEGLKELFLLWLRYAKGLPTTGPEAMINWRMLLVHLSTHLSPTIGWVIAGMGMALTAGLTFYLWKKLPPNDSEAFVVAFLGTIAATLAITWHSHFHLGMLLFPPIIWLYHTKIFPQSLFYVWVFAPIATLFLIYVVGALAQIAKITLPLYWGGFLLGSCFLALNLCFLIWSVKTLSIKANAD